MDKPLATLIAVCSATLAFTFGAISENSWDWVNDPPPQVRMTQVRLIGLGCQGTDKPIYAVHEDDFPPCEAIQEL